VKGAGFERIVCIDAGHPALAGHFPGRPVVPGVLLLEQVASALHAWRGQRLTLVREAKFMVPLLPGQTAVLRLTQADARTGFEIHRGDDLLARGLVEGTA
jgi:3-hydroxymyristoyl/3-hydroxydecanoyl-(acyl carrier protein) dehydratase